MLAAQGAAGLTTALVAVVVDGTVQGASVGDSEAWLVSNTDAIVLTEAQSGRLQDDFTVLVCRQGG